MKTQVFRQDGEGYRELLAALAQAYPSISQVSYRFLSEPSYAKPFCHSLRRAGFQSEQVRWTDTRQVSFFRRKGPKGAGKNDAEDARALAGICFAVDSDPTAYRVFEVPEVNKLAAMLGDLAKEHERLSKQSVQLQNKIVQFVWLLFPEAQRVWKRKESGLKANGEKYSREVMSLFSGVTPMRVLLHFPGAADLRAAGFEGVWQVAGGPGVSKAGIQEIVRLAEQSGGLNDPLQSERLQLLIEEYLEVKERLSRYEGKMEAICEQNEVLSSFRQVKFLSIQGLATIVGAMGDVRRYRNADQMKSYLHIAPRPLPQTGKIDEDGHVVQMWRFPANSYKTVNGQRRLEYKSSGRSDVRQVGYLWFQSLVQGHRRCPDEAFSRYYQALKVKHQGKRTYWLGRVRWKVVAKLVETIYYCLRSNCPYDPDKVAPRS